MLRLTVFIVKYRKKTLIYDCDDDIDEKNSNIFRASREFSAYRPTDAVNNRKGVDLYIKLLNVRTF